MFRPGQDTLPGWEEGEELDLLPLQLMGSSQGSPRMQSKI